jgi:hypothetical protein
MCENVVTVVNFIYYFLSLLLCVSFSTQFIISYIIDSPLLITHRYSLLTTH